MWRTIEPQGQALIIARTTGPLGASRAVFGTIAVKQTGLLAKALRANQTLGTIRVCLASLLAATLASTLPIAPYAIGLTGALGGQFVAWTDALLDVIGVTCHEQVVI